MKIAFLSPFYPFRGGIAQFSDSLLAGLQEKNEVKTFSFKRQYPGLFFPGSSQYVLKDESQRSVQTEFILDSINPFTYSKTANEIIRYNSDLSLMSYWMPFFAPSLGCVARHVRKKGKKVISILHNVIPHEKRFFDSTLTKYFLKHNDAFILLNKKSENDLLSIYPKAKFITQPHPIYNHYGEKQNQDEAKRKLNIPLEKKIILFFGFIRDYKGLDLLIDAVSKLSDEYVLLIAGEVYGSFEKYNQQIEKLGIQKKVSLHARYIANSEVPLFFSAADVCVLPYKSATQSGITSIAYHFELPLIATNIGGLKETIYHNKTGIIIDLPDSMLIAEAIKNYFLQNLKSKFQDEIKLLKNQLSWSNLANAIIEFSKSL
ncbi:MAG: glycosyltransferase [Bacteroidetes bacterium]|nr:glycosyltransferase [Bacteroidota bacterium]